MQICFKSQSWCWWIFAPPSTTPPSPTGSRFCDNFFKQNFSCKYFCDKLLQQTFLVATYINQILQQNVAPKWFCMIMQSFACAVLICLLVQKTNLGKLLHKTLLVLVRSLQSWSTCTKKRLPIFFKHLPTLLAQQTDSFTSSHSYGKLGRSACNVWISLIGRRWSWLAGSPSGCTSQTLW